MIIGYTAGVYDLFHIWHLNLLKNAKGMCDKLIVWVTVDELVKYKWKNSLIPYEDRAEIVRSIKYVDAVVPQEDMDKLKMCKKLWATYMFVGDDWYATEKWQKYEEDFKKEGIKIIYFPYTKGISSTKITEALQHARGWSRVPKPKLNLDEDVNKIDKDFCLSSYIAYRYIYKDNVNFYKWMKHKLIKAIPLNKRVGVKTSDDIDKEIQEQFDELYKKYDKIGILLSGGQDSAILASYLKPGSNAYTFTTKLDSIYKDDLERSKKYCKKYKLNQVMVDISFEDYKKYSPIVCKTKCAPVHSIEPQIYKAALMAKENGDELMIVWESSDLIFGGMDKLLAKDWDFDEFAKRYTFLDPKSVLKNPVDVSDLFERYRLPYNKIDFLKFMDEVFSIESSSSYLNAFNTAKIDYYDPYAKLIMAEPLDLHRVRNWEPKYLIRALFAKKYPEIPVPDKIPMPRPVDVIFKDWWWPKRKEFKPDIDMNKLTGNQKWQLWCAEQFLNEYDK